MTDQLKYGKIIRLNRQLNNLKLDFVAKKTGISKSQLSRIELNKEDISKENIEKIFNIMNLQTNNKNIDLLFENDFYNFYENIVYDRNFNSSYQKILSYSSYIQTTLSYVKYLLAQMIYSIVKNKNDNFQPYLYIEDYLEYLESYQIQIYYDYIGTSLYLLNDYKRANHYFKIANSYKGDVLSESMLYYHESMNYRHIGYLSLSYEYIKKAYHIFADSLNIKRLILSKMQIAIIENNKRNFKESVIIFNQCIKASKELNIHIISTLYNNLLWTYLLWGKYDKVIQLKDEANQYMINDHRLYFYLSYAYEQLELHEEAKKFIKLAKTYMKNPTSYMEKMIYAYSIYLSHSNIEKKEKYLLSVYQAVQSSHDQELIVFILDLLIHFYKTNNDVEKAFHYQEKLLDYYKKTY